MNSSVGEAHRSAVALARDHLADTMREVLGNKTPGTFELLIPPRTVADDIAKILFRTASGKPGAVILFAPPLFPKKVLETVEACEAARRSLGEDLGSVILKTLASGFLEGRSYAAIPYCRLLSENALWGRMQNLRLSPALLHWLRGATRQTMSALTPTEMGPALELPLEHLAALKESSDRVRSAAREALGRVGEASWHPQGVLMHADLWRGNVMKPPAPIGSEVPRSWGRRFTITDWHGSRTRGFPIYDLVRLALSLRLEPRRLKAEVLAHCEILGCGYREARLYLLAALGYLGMNLHCFPFEAYVRQVEMCFEALDRAER